MTDLGIVGTLRLCDTDVRCDVRGVRLLRVVCAKACSPAQIGADHVIGMLWSALVACHGWHNGCDRAGYRASNDQDRNVCPACGEASCQGRRVWDS